jgi:hypothetical protein
MTSLTTIKVPREVRDRLASHARRDDVTLAMTTTGSGGTAGEARRDLSR